MQIAADSPPLPRIGMSLTMPLPFQHMSFFGRGPFETYPDRYTVYIKIYL